MKLRTFGRIGIGAILVAAAIAAAWGFSGTPWDLFPGYRAARWAMAAAGPLERLPAEKPVPPREPWCDAGPRPKHPDTADAYFPFGVLGCSEREEEFLTDWYESALKAMREPSLWALSKSDPHAEVYRFLWLRSFNRPIAVRLVVNANQEGQVITKVLAMAEVIEAGDLIASRTQTVGRHSTGLFQARASEARLWELLPRRAPPAPDGAMWILEAVRDGQYRIVDRQSPPEGDPVYTLGMTLMRDIAGIRLDPREIY